MSDTATRPAPDPKLALAVKAAQLLDKLVTDPEHGAAAKRMIKKINPEANFPEVDIEDRVTAAVAERTAAFDAKVKAWEDKQAERDKAAEDARIESDFAKRLDAVKGRYRLTDEGVDKIIERMRAQNSPDVEAAAAWLNEQTAKPAPPPGSNLLPSTLDLWGTQSKDEAFKALHDNPMSYFDREVRAVLADESLR